MFTFDEIALKIFALPSIFFLSFLSFFFFCGHRILLTFTVCGSFYKLGAWTLNKGGSAGGVSGAEPVIDR